MTFRASLAALVGAVLAVAMAGSAHADPARAAEWQAEFLHYQQLQSITRGEGVTVAVLDTGVEATQADLTGSVLPGIDAWTNAHDGRRDESFHGTGVAALIAGHGHGKDNADGVVGVAPGAKILPVTVWPPGTHGLHPDDVAAGIHYAVDHGAQVICIAGGGSGDNTLDQAIKYAAAKGVPIVAAAGNPPDPTVMDPAGNRDVIAVSGIGRTGEFDAKASVDGLEIAFAAPGVDIMVPRPGGGYAPATGTSASAALVAGVLALLKAKYPKLDNKGLYRRLQATAIDKGPAGHDDQYGWGVIDPVAALTADVRETPSASATPEPTHSPQVLSGGRSTATKVVLTVLILAGYVVVLGGLVAGVVWLVRRRRRRARAVEVTSAPSEPSPTGAPLAEDADWRRPGPGT